MLEAQHTVEQQTSDGQKQWVSEQFLNGTSAQLGYSVLNK